MMMTKTYSVHHRIYLTKLKYGHIINFFLQYAFESNEIQIKLNFVLKLKKKQKHKHNTFIEFNANTMSGEAHKR